MIKQKGRLHRQVLVLGSAFGSTGSLAKGLWRRGSTKRFMVPLAIFLCVTGLLLVIAASVEALSPLIYSMF